MQVDGECALLLMYTDPDMYIKELGLVAYKLDAGYNNSLSLCETTPNSTKELALLFVVSMLSNLYCQTESQGITFHF